MKKLTLTFAVLSLLFAGSLSAERPSWRTTDNETYKREKVEKKAAKKAAKKEIAVSPYKYPKHRQVQKGPYVAKDFSYLLDKSPGFSKALLELHFTLYNGYVKNTNALTDAINEEINSGKDSSIVYMALKRRYGWEYDGMRLHELYFENMGGNGDCDTKYEICERIIDTFGSFDRFKSEFKATGLIRGIGWVILYLGPQDDRLHIVWINEHDLGHLAGGVPLLVMDVWEHAYITEFGLNRGNYIDTFFNIIDWKVVNSRLKGG